MRTNYVFLAITAFVLLTGSCNDNNQSDNLETTTYDIAVNTSIGQMTRTATTGNTTTFVNGDKISIYAWTDSVSQVPDTRVVDNAVNTLSIDGDNKKWTADSRMLWKDSKTPHYFLSVYPSKEIADFKTGAYTLDASKQDTSDLLIAVQAGTDNAGLTATSTPVPLLFDHVMAKLNVNLTFRNQWATTPDVASVIAKASDKATIDYLAKKATASGEQADITLQKVSDNTSYTSIMIPQTGFTTITITIDSKVYVYTHNTDIKLEGGKYTTVNLIVGSDTIEVGDISVNEWDSSESIEGGEALN